MAKKRAIGRYPKAFRKMAVERLKSCENIVALSEELGVHLAPPYSGVISWSRSMTATDPLQSLESVNCGKSSAC